MRALIKSAHALGQLKNHFQQSAKIVLAVLISAFVLLSTSGHRSVSSAVQLGSWATKSPMPTSRSSVAVSVINGKLYVAGGVRGPHGCCDTDAGALEVYDPLNNTWTPKAPMSQPRSGAKSAVINGKLYVVGGYSYGLSADLATLEVYDPATDSWATKTSMPTARRWAVVEAVNGLLYVIGGTRNDLTNFGAVEVYDPVTDTWDTTKASMPTARSAMTSAVINGKIYIAGGGLSNGLTVATLEVYDPFTNTWDTTKSSLPFARMYSGGGVISGQFYVVAGSLDNSISNITISLVAYDPITNTWADKAPIPTGRSRLGEVGVINGLLYVAGGWTASSDNLATLEVFVPGAPPTPTPTCAPPPSGLVSWWPADGNANDIRNGNNGTLQGGATFASGTVGQAVILDGIDDYINVPISDSLNTLNTAFTVECWVNPELPLAPPLPGSEVGVGTVFARREAGISEGLALYLLGNGKVSIVIRTTTSPTISGSIFVSTNPVVQFNNQWKHVAATANTTTGQVKLFVNGQEIGLTNAFGPATLSGQLYLFNLNNLFIGRRQDAATIEGAAGAAYYKGLIDELSLFSRELSPSEIQAIFQAGSAGKCKTAPACSLNCTATVAPSATVGTPVQFVATSNQSGCTGSFIYDWDFGDGSPHSSQQSPSHVYTAAGSFTWKLTVAIPGASACVKTGTIGVESIAPRPLITDINPKEIPIGIDRTLTVEGSGFKQGFSAKVKVGSNVFPVNPGAQTLFLSPNRVQVIVKIGGLNDSTTSFSLSIVNPDGQASPEFTGLQAIRGGTAPKLDSLSPDDLLAGAEAIVTARGSGFRRDSSVTIRDGRGNIVQAAIRTIFIDSAKIKIVLTIGRPTDPSIVYTAQICNESANCSNPVTLRVEPVMANLAARMTVTPATTVTPGSNINYAIKIYNWGPSTAPEVRVVDILPANTMFVSCTLLDGGVCEGDGNRRRISFASIPAGQERRITLIAKVLNTIGAGAVINNTATVVSTIFDNNLINNSVTRTLTVINPERPPSISSLSPDSGLQGQTIEDFTVVGHFFQPTSVFTFSGTGVTVNSYLSRAPRQIVANITVEGNAVGGLRDVTVINPDGQRATLNSAFRVIPTVKLFTSTPPDIASKAPLGINSGQLEQLLQSTLRVETENELSGNMRFPGDKCYGGAVKAAEERLREHFLNTTLRQLAIDIVGQAVGTVITTGKPAGDLLLKTGAYLISLPSSEQRAEDTVKFAVESATPFLFKNLVGDYLADNISGNLTDSKVVANLLNQEKIISVEVSGTNLKSHPDVPDAKVNVHMLYSDNTHFVVTAIRAECALSGGGQETKLYTIRYEVYEDPTIRNGFKVVPGSLVFIDVLDKKVSQGN